MSQKVDKKLVSPPDGGWGWVVVFASFMIHLIADGVIFSFGVFHHELVKYFESSEGATSLIASILVGFTLCVGPIASALVNKFGCRLVVVVGGMMGAFGIIISAFANNIITLQICIGVIAGTGLGLIYLPATVSVTSYFNKKRSLATGISVCGSGMGTFIMAPVTQFLVQEYGWRGAMVLSGGFILNIVVFGLLLRPLKIEPSHSYSENKVESLEDKEDTELNNESHGLISSQLKNNKYDLNAINHQECTSKLLLKSTDVKQTGEKFMLEDKLETTAKYDVCLSDSSTAITKMLDFTLFNNYVFILFSVSNFCTSLGFNVPFVYIVSQAQMKGIPEREGSFLLSIIGIANTSGRIILGYFFDQKFVNRLWIYNLCLIIGGLSTALSMLCTGMTGFAIYAAIFGFTVGAYAGLTSVIVVDLLGLEKLSSVFGLLLLFQGIANLLGPPITGWIYDATQSFMPGFIAAGAVITGSGLLLFTLPSVQAHTSKKSTPLRKA